jgi:hypothetical protein
MEKPSCIRELKQLANSLTGIDIDLKGCMDKIKNIVSTKDIDDSQKVLKIKELCEEYGK